MRLGVVVIVRVAGAVTHRLDATRVQVRGRRLAVTVRNRGNVVEPIGPRSFRVLLRRGGRVVAAPAVPRRELLPGARGVLELPTPPRLQGVVRVVVEARDAAGALVRRLFAVRLGADRLGAKGRGR